MKIAITGKGGVGKTTLASLLVHLYAEEGRRVIAVDADPDANLASALGISKEDAEKMLQALNNDEKKTQKKLVRKESTRISIDKQW